MMKTFSMSGTRPPLGLLWRMAILYLVAGLGASAAWAQGQLSPLGSAAQQAQDRSVIIPGDRIVAVVNQELVTAFEVQRRLERSTEEARGSGVALPEPAEGRRQVLESLIAERAVLSHARLVGGSVDDLELDRAVQTVAAQNQMSLETLRERLKDEGIDLARFRANLRDQLLVERVREREVNQRIQIADRDVEDVIEARRAATGQDPQIQWAQILIKVPEDASAAQVQGLQQRAERALARVRAGEPFEKVVAEVSEDASREQGGTMGARKLSRLPDLFAKAMSTLEVGQNSGLIRSGAGFHILKVLGKEAAGSLTVVQTRARHILLRTNQRVSAEAAAKRLSTLRQDIALGRRSFEAAAREFSEDGAAPNGGDLGWFTPGMMVPEFQQAVDLLQVGGLSQPIVSRFGVHLVRVDDRREVEVDLRQQRDQIRAQLRSQKFEQAYTDWVRELRDRAYVELREQDGL